MNLITSKTRIGCGLALIGLLVGSAGCASTGERRARELWAQDASLYVARADTAAGEPADWLETSGAGLSSYVEHGLERNRAVRAARADWKAAIERITPAGTLPEPVLRYGLFLQSVETRVGPQKQRLGVSQSFPWFGTLGLRKDVAAATAEGARQRYRNALVESAHDIISAYAEYHYLAAARDITRENLDLLIGWERIIRARYSAGSAAYNDLIKVQVELGILEDRVHSLEDRLNPARARLNALVDLPPDTPVRTGGGLPEPSEPAGEEDLQRRMHDDNPELLALRARVEQEEHGVDLAGKAGAPRFTLGLDWIQTDPRNVPGLEDDGKDPLMASVAVQVPLWRGSYGAEKREARARRESARERLAARSDMLEQELAEQLFRYRDARRRVDLYRDALIPKGDQSLQASYAAYEAGEGDFLQVLDAERALLEFGLSLESARADRVQAQAALNALVGGGEAAQ